MKDRISREEIIALICVGFCLLAVSYSAWLLTVPESADFGHLVLNLFAAGLILIMSLGFHELAHACVGRAVGLGTGEISVGLGRLLFSVPMGRVRLWFRAIPLSGIAVLLHEQGATRLRLKYFVAVAAGPLSNLALGLLALMFMRNEELTFTTGFPVWHLVAMAQFWLVVNNLIPWVVPTSHGEIPTDGLSLLDLLFSRTPRLLGQQFSIQVAQTNGATTSIR